MSRRRRSPWVAVGLIALTALSACTDTTQRASSPSAPSPRSSTTTIASPPTPSPSSVPSPSHRPTPPPGPAPSVAQRVLAELNLQQRVGQLFMVGTGSGIDDAAAAAITGNHVGSVILMRANERGVAGVAATTAQWQVLAGSRVRLFVATDQEGGEVQRMTGPGFSTIPSALQQGRVTPATLRALAMGWGRELRAAGINVDLAPVLDTVPSAALAPANPPIGGFDREFGFDPQTVATHGSAVAGGLATAGISATAKHFPGLGRVTANTDTRAGVTDTQTTRDDPYLAPFAQAIRGGVPFVMMSTAVYSRIDPANPAAFSAAIISGVLRTRLGFRGVVISDDVGIAAQVEAVPTADRALRFIAAGGDIVLTVDASQIPDMTAAVIARAQRDPVFAAQVNAAALRVLSAKQVRGLL